MKSETKNRRRLIKESSKKRKNIVFFSFFSKKIEKKTMKNWKILVELKNQQN